MFIGANKITPAQIHLWSIQDRERALPKMNPVLKWFKSIPCPQVPECHSQCVQDARPLADGQTCWPLSPCTVIPSLVSKEGREKGLTADAFLLLDCSGLSVDVTLTDMV